jgi:nucleoside phosphorylase
VSLPRHVQSLSLGQFNGPVLRGKDRYPDLIAVEMEGGSMGYIAQNLRKDFRNLEFLSVRGISDLCAEKEDDVWRDVAADTAAAVLIGYLFHKAWLPVFEETSE